MIPRTVMILGEPFKVRRKRMKEFGICDSDAKTIWLRSGLKGDAAITTLLHECIHAILFRSGNSFSIASEAEESIVRALEHGLHSAGYRLIEN